VRRDADPVRMDDIPSPEFPGWLHGKLFLTRSSLEDACREIEARFDVTVRTIAPSSTTITGVLEAASADDALRSLSLLTGKELRKDHGTYVFE
jgi:ferric-dicitrate binding protein FerR (iron transport regulator)